LHVSRLDVVRIRQVAARQTTAVARNGSSRLFAFQLDGCLDDSRNDKYCAGAATLEEDRNRKQLLSFLNARSKLLRNLADIHPVQILVVALSGETK